MVEALRDGLAARGWRIVSPSPLRPGILAAVPTDGAARKAWKELEDVGGSSPSPRKPASQNAAVSATLASCPEGLK